MRVKVKVSLFLTIVAYLCQLIVAATPSQATIAQTILEPGSSIERSHNAKIAMRHVHSSSNRSHLAGSWGPSPIKIGGFLGERVDALEHLARTRRSKLFSRFHLFTWCIIDDVTGEQWVSIVLMS
jgi:hypothetical protein